MARTLERELESLLSENVASAKRRGQSAFDEIAGTRTNSIVLLGAGGLGRKTLKGLRELGIQPIAFADNNQALWGQSVDGLTVLPPAEAAKLHGSDAVFVVTIWRAGGTHRFDRTQEQLRQLGCQRIAHVALLFWKHAEKFLDYYCLGLPHSVLAEAGTIREVFSWWADDVSRREYVSQIRWRLHADFGCLASPDAQEQYFPEDVFRLTNNEVFIDCGAFDGDSIETFVRRQGNAFNQIVALEPDPANFQKLAGRVSQYSAEAQRKIRIEKLGASDFNGTLRFAADGSLSSAADPNGSLEIQCVKLDELLSAVSPTYLKMDIEGAEPEALRGAASLIQKSTPLLAVSAYHKQNHLWQIPKLIRSLNPSYQFYLRPHNEEGWDTVCYAVPTAR